MERELTIRRDRAPGSQRLHGSIAQEIGTAILSGRYRPGDLLPNEVSFSGQLDVSRTAYREAIRILAAKGMVASRPKAGTSITPRGQWNFLDPDVLRWVFEAGPPEPAFLKELFELRAIVEPSAAALAAVRRSADHVEQLRRALDAMTRHGLGNDEGRDADRLFHETILRATGNDTLATLASGISAAVRWTTIFKARDGRLPRDPLPDHEAVFRAIEARDADAAQRTMAELVGLALADVRRVEPHLR